MMTPREQAQYRAETESRHAKMAGVGSPTFICKRCKQPRPVKGRVAVEKGSSKHGYLCYTCSSSVS